MRFLLNTDPGLEEVTVEEIADRLSRGGARPRPYGVAGQVLVESDAFGDLLPLTTVHHIVEIRDETQVASLDEVRRALARVDFPELADAASFRVSCRLEGRHPFARMDVERAAGGVVQERYGTRVDLEWPALDIRVDLFGRQLVTGLQRTDKDLGNRIRRARVLRTSLKPTIGAAMVRLAGAHRGTGRLIDPLCGTGTIPIEAKLANPALAVVASDWDEPTVETARATIANHELDVELRVGDARSLGLNWPGSFDYIVCDPPYGVRLGKRSSMQRLYSELLQSFERGLADRGRVVIVVLKFRAFLRALAPTALAITDERLIECGGLHPRIFVLSRR